MSQPISLVPSALREASLDSPTFRGTVLHYNEQADHVEKWLDSFTKATSKLINELLALEPVLNNFLLQAVPTDLSETIIDHDYTLFAMQRYVDGSKGFWSNVIVGAKKVDKMVLQPLLAFQRTELKNFKDTRRALEAAQAKYDPLLARYLSQSKTKEPSALREDAFQVYEARKAYFKTCYDYCVAAPALRAALDRTVTKVLSDMWREQMSLRKDTTNIADRCRADIERIRAWSDSMDSNAATFRKQLTTARKELEERSKKGYQPARELDEYSVSTVPYLTSRSGAGNTTVQSDDDGPSEKRGWLFMRTLTGKPTRTAWIRRWFFLQNGIFGWLVQGYRNGGLEESEKIGVLLCNVKPAFQEERRFCFEVKTKDTTVLLQAETQADLISWLAVFERAKRTAVNSSSLNPSTQAFSVIPPSAPAPNEKEPAYITKGHDGNSAGTSLSGPGKDGDRLPLKIPRHLRREGRTSTDDRDEGQTFERSFTLGAEIGAGAPPPSRGASMDVGRGASGTLSVVTPGTRLDPNRKTSGTDRNSPASANTPISAGGISALIAASHTMLPFQPAEPLRPNPPNQVKSSSLAPGSLISTPAPVNLLTAAALTTGRVSGATVEAAHPPGSDAAVASKGHRKTVSLDFGREKEGGAGGSEVMEYPFGYPPELMVQDHHFRILFPGHWDEVVLLVFRATWSPNDSQELPGRCYVTSTTLYFYSHYQGLVFTNITPLSAITEVTAAPERECDYVFMHLRPKGDGEQTEPRNQVDRITLKVFLEPLRLLHRRLHFLVRNANSTEFDDPPRLDADKLLARLVEMEKEVDVRSTDTESWEDLGLIAADAADIVKRREGTGPLDIRIDHDPVQLIRTDEKPKELTQIRMPTGPVEYTPEETMQLSLDRDFDVPAQALFHTMFGDMSPLFQALYEERRAQNIDQGAWVKLEDGKLRRRFGYNMGYVDFWGRSRTADVEDYQTIEKQDDHICYVVSDVKTPWHLPHREDFMLVSKIVITFVAQSKCKLSIWTAVKWSKEPRLSKGIIETQALDDLEDDALDLGDVVGDHVRKLGTVARTKKAITMFGPVGGGPTSGDSAVRPSLAPTATPAAGKTPRAAKRITQRRLTQLLLDTGLSFASSVLTSLIMWTVGGVKAVGSIISANRVILLALLASIIANMVLTGRSTTSYWNIRRVSKLLDEVEIKPNGIMSRAIYLRDLDDVIHNSTSLTGGAHPLTPLYKDSMCYRKFQEAALIANADLDRVITDDDNGDSDSSYSTYTASPIARRIRTGRQKLGGYRNDLMVALRLVNSLERGLLEAEWGNWVAAEKGRCDAVVGMLMEEGVDGGISAEEKEKVWNALKKYCGSCEKEQKILMGGSGAVEVGAGAGAGAGAEGDEL